jgi:hypothetical protein
VTILEWADTEIFQGITIGDRYAELLTVNGGTSEIKQVGSTVATTENRYGRKGLQLNEALELASMTGSLVIFMKLQPKLLPEFVELIKMKSQGRQVMLYTADQLTQQIH